jgi:putative polyhydroxyalkanoate system protein
LKTLHLQEISALPDIHILRNHQLGLVRARQVAREWAEEAQSKLDMECILTEGIERDTLDFKRTGVKGRLIVEAHQFCVEATLGVLLSSFRKTIEAEIEKNLDDLLGATQGRF